MEDVDGASVVVLQRGSHHHIVVGILVEVPHGGDGGPESGILVAVGVLQRSVIDEPGLYKQGQEKARALGSILSGLQRLPSIPCPPWPGSGGLASGPVPLADAGVRQGPGRVPVPTQPYLSQAVHVHPAPLPALAEVHGRAHQQDVRHAVAVDVHRGDLAPVVRAYLRHRDGGGQRGLASRGQGNPGQPLTQNFG